MNTYKLSNIIKREVLNDNKFRHYTSMKKQKFSFTFLRDLCAKYRVSEWTEYEHCCRNEDYNCWIEVHSSWMYKNGELDTDFNKRVYSSIKRIINAHLTKKQIGKRSIFVSENNRAVFVCIPMRDTSSKSDHWLIFDKRQTIVS
jgi:hypothetical protein